MRSRLLLVALFTLAVVAPIEFSQAGILPGSSDGSENSLTASASSGGCLPPSVAVDMYLEAGREDAFDRGDDTEEACARICDKFVDTCDEIAKISRTCQNRGGGKFAQLLKTTCGTLETKADRESCKDEIEFAQDTIKQCTDDDRDRARGCCENHRTVCLKDCLDEDIFPWDTQACFTGPGGYAGGTCWFTLFNNPS